jgi:hypothetical protein
MISINSRIPTNERVNLAFTFPQGQRKVPALATNHLEAGAASDMVYI